MKNCLLYGFNIDEISKVKNLFKFVSSKIEYITILNSDFDKTLREVIENNNFVEEENFNLKEKIVILGGMYPKEIEVYYKILKSKLSKEIIIASVTENSLNMKVEELFDHFKEEREYFRKNKR